VGGRCLDVASRGQVMGQQLRLAFDEIGTSQRRNTEVRLTHRWSKPDSNPQSHVGFAVGRADREMISISAKESLSLFEGDQRFESAFLQRRVREPSVPPAISRARCQVEATYFAGLCRAGMPEE